MVFGLGGRIHGPQNQEDSFLETPGYFNQTRNIPNHFGKNIDFGNLEMSETDLFGDFGKDGNRQNLKIRLVCFENLEHKINIFQKT